MRHVVKYLLVLALLMSGFYMARMFRVPQSIDVEGEIPGESSSPVPQTPDEDLDARTVPDGLPVAALGDVDNVPTAVIDELGDFDNRQSMRRIETKDGRSEIDTQPTVRNSETKSRKGAAADRETRSSPRVPRGATYDTAVPDFAADYEPWLEPLEESAQPERTHVESYHGSVSQVDSSTGDDLEQDHRLRRHRIVEGDTLQRLAARYLGDRERYLELYEANVDVLFDPRLLPIGIEIVLPDAADRLLAREDEDSDDLTAQADPFGDMEDVPTRTESTYSPWGDY